MVAVINLHFSSTKKIGKRYILYILDIINLVYPSYTSYLPEHSDTIGEYLFFLPVCIRMFGVFFYLPFEPLFIAQTTLVNSTHAATWAD